MNAFTMAWRNVWRNSRRTLAAVSATTLGLLAMIVYSGLVRGYLDRMERHVLDVEMGDVQVHHPRYLGSPSLYERIDDPHAVLSALDEAGLPAAPRLLGSGLAAAGQSSAGASLVGIDVARDAAVSGIHEHVGEGRWLDSTAPHEVVIGRRLAQMLGVGVGDELVVLSQAADGSTANDLYTVRGILRGVSEAVDRSGIYMVEPAFRELMVVPDGAHELIVRRGTHELAAAAAAVRAAAPGLDARTWRELRPTMASMLDSAVGAMTMMFFIVYAAIGIVILNAMLMAVFERVREFGVLKAIGVGPGGVLRLIYLETLVQTGIAVAVGVALAIPANAYLSTTGIDLGGEGLTLMGSTVDPLWRSHVTVQTYTTPVIALVAIVLVAVTYPAVRAALIEPITAIRHQ
jgi:ABC-type lipoprotein release transport system permease subunit